MLTGTCICTCTCRSMEVDLEGVNGKNYSLVINNLFGTIIPDQSSGKVGWAQYMLFNYIAEAILLG